MDAWRDALKCITADLGIPRGALKEWVDRFGSGAMTTAPAAAQVSVVL